VKQQKPILHGRDHGCGGADPLPGYCILLRDVTALQQQMMGGDFVSVQTAMSVMSGAGSVTAGIENWPDITITDVIEHTTNGWDLWAHVTCNVQNVQQVGLEIEWAGGGSINSGSIPSGSWPFWTHVDFSGVIQPNDPGYTGPDELTASLRQHPTGSGSMYCSGGIAALTWVLASGTPPDATPGTKWTGSYPLVDSDVDPLANIQPTKISHPGTTTLFLRGDGTWTQTTFQVEY
jgi:hypothetical protein